MTKSKERVGEITISAPFHAVILVIGQLITVLIEGDGQFSRRIIIAEEHIGNGRSALLPGIPCLYNGVAGCGFRLQSNSRPRTVHIDKLLACSVKGLDEIPLNTWKFDVCSVSSLEPRYVHRHFFAFQSR